MQPNLRRARQLVMELMAIPGKSCQEAAAAEYVREKLLAAGLPESALQHDTAHRRSPYGGQIGNLIVRLPGGRREPRRMLSAHLDTVPICVGSQPRLKNNLVRSKDPSTGLGADNRAGCAVILSAALELLERDLPHPPLTFCWFVQEEIGLQGARCVTRSLLGKPKLAFNWDGGSPFKLTIGATGGYRMDIEVQGIASHAGGAPEWGVSAIGIAALAIADLQKDGWHGLIRKGRKTGTSNVGYIHGGEATNVVTDCVLLRAEARSHDPVFRKRIVARIEQAFNKAVDAVKNVAGAVGSVKIQGRLDYESFRLDKNADCVKEAEAAVTALGLTPQLAIANGGVDANWTNAYGIPTVSIGCGQLNQHMTSEALDIEQFDDACRIALRLAAPDTAA